MPLEDRLAALPLASLVIHQVALSWLLRYRKMMTMWSQVASQPENKACGECLAVTGHGERCRLICVCGLGSYSGLGQVLFQSFIHV